MFNSLLSLNSINFGMLCFMFYFYQDIQVSFWILVFDSTVDRMYVVNFHISVFLLILHYFFLVSFQNVFRKDT